MHWVMSEAYCYVCPTISKREASEKSLLVVLSNCYLPNKDSIKMKQNSIVTKLQSGSKGKFNFKSVRPHKSFY